jgi:hypothetical protein
VTILHFIALHKAEFCFHFRARTDVATMTFLGFFLKLETFWLLLKIRYAVVAFKVDLMEHKVLFPKQTAARWKEK